MTLNDCEFGPHAITSRVLKLCLVYGVLGMEPRAPASQMRAFPAATAALHVLGERQSDSNNKKQGREGGSEVGLIYTVSFRSPSPNQGGGSTVAERLPSAGTNIQGKGH